MDYFFQYQFKCSSMTNDFPIIIWVCEMKFRKWICSSIVEWDLLHFPLWITLNLWLVQLLLVFFPLTGMSKFHDLIQLKKKSAGATFYICNSNLSPLYICCCSICSSQACDVLFLFSFFFFSSHIFMSLATSMLWEGLGVLEDVLRRKFMQMLPTIPQKERAMILVQSFHLSLALAVHQFLSHCLQILLTGGFSPMVNKGQ